MKLKYIVILSAALCLLTGCGGKKETVSSEGTAVTTAKTTAKVSVTTTTAAKTTTTVTTAKAASEPPKDLVLKGRDAVEVYEDITLGEFVTEKNVELKDASVRLNTSDTGFFEEVNSSRSFSIQ